MGERDKSLKFVKLVYRLRTLGLGLALLPVAAVLYRQQAPAWLWALLFASCLAWPPLAWWHAARAARPLHHEQFNLLADAAMLGAWIAVMHFALLPAVLLASMMAMDRISAGGWPLLAKAALAGVAGCVPVAWAIHAPWQPVSDMLGVATCLPMLAIYPNWLSTVTFRQAQRIRQQNRLLERLNRTDTLTGLANRAHWLDTAALEMQRYRRNQRRAALILLDVDGFKQVNDNHGHAAGDLLLQRLAMVLRDSLRSVDTPGRLGGDEFGVVLPETGVERAAEVAERIRQQVLRIPDIAGVAGQPCTISLGVAEVGPWHANLEAWIRQADLVLYRAKAQGRNRVCVSARGERPD